MNAEEVVEDDMDPVSVLEARIQEKKDKAPEVPSMIETFITEVSEMHAMLHEWDYPAMEQVKKTPLDVFVGVVEEPVANANDAQTPQPWYRRLLKKVPAPVQLAVMRKEATRKAAAWEVASVNADASGLYIEIYVDVKTGAVYFKNLHKPLAYELSSEHLIDCSYSDMERLLESLRAKTRSIAWDIKNRDWTAEADAQYAQKQAEALEDVRTRLGMTAPAHHAIDEPESVESHS